MSFRRTPAAGLAFIAGATLLLSACAPGGGGTGSSPADDPSAPTGQTVTGADYNPQERDALEAGGEVVYPIDEITPQMNPFHPDGQVATEIINAYVVPRLILAEPDGTAVPNPDYLDQVEVTEADGKTVITYDINDKAVWNDGTAIDVTAFQATWTALRSYDEGYVPNSTSGYEDIESVEAGDSDRQVVVTFDKIYPWTDFMFGRVLHPSIDTPEKFNEGFMNDPRAEIGAGPYTVETFDPQGGRVVMVPNESWWGEAPLLEKVTFRQLEDVAALNAFKAGETNSSGTLSVDSLAQIEDQDGVTVYRAQRVVRNLIMLNGETEQFRDLEVRDAVLRAVNRDQIKQVIWQGLDYSEADIGSFQFYPFEPEYRDSLTASGWAYDVDEANRLLDEAGWERGDDGIREKDGVRLTAAFPTFGDDPIVEARARVFQQQFAEIGLEMTIDARPGSEFSTVINDRQWDILLLGFSSGAATGVQHMCQNYCSDSQLNDSGTGNADIDKRIKALGDLPTKDEQNAAGLDLEVDILKETRGLLPLWSGPEMRAYTTGLANLTPEAYAGLDLYGIRGVENTGWMKGMVP